MTSGVRNFTSDSCWMTGWLLLQQPASRMNDWAGTVSGPARVSVVHFLVLITLGVNKMNWTNNLWEVFTPLRSWGIRRNREESGGFSFLPNREPSWPCVYLSRFFFIFPVCARLPLAQFQSASNPEPSSTSVMSATGDWVWGCDRLQNNTYPLSVLKWMQK